MFCNQSSAFGLNQLKNEEEELEEQLMEERKINPSRELGREQQLEIPKEPLFEKPLTPSDVGKLNRLVIPKHHALKYFPLNGSESGENGFLLGFEDEVGKSWRFRYSYWNSSQSYVLTKGWSRFVKEKKLDAGDIVLFGRHRVDFDRLFIGWRRRNSAGISGVAQSDTAVATGPGDKSGSWTRVLYSAHPYPNQLQESSSLPFPYQPDCLHTVLHNQTTASGNINNSKRLRLFGVNLEFQLAGDESEPILLQPSQ